MQTHEFSERRSVQSAKARNQTGRRRPRHEGPLESLIIPFDCDRHRAATKWSPGEPTLRLHIGRDNVEDLKADLDCGFAALKAA